MKLYDFFEDLIDKFLKPSKRVKNILNNKRQKQKSKNKCLTNQIDHIIQTDDNLKLKPATYFSVMAKTFFVILLFILTFWGSYFVLRKDMEDISHKKDSLMITNMKYVKCVSDKLHIKPLSGVLKSILEYFSNRGCWQGRDLMIELQDDKNLTYVGELYGILLCLMFFILIIVYLVWLISFYLFPKILNVLTCLLSMMYGFLSGFGMFIFISLIEFTKTIILSDKEIISHNDYPSIFNWLPFTLLVLPFIITFITMFVAVLLYQRKKNKHERFNEGFYRFTNYLIIFLFFMNIIIHFYYLYFSVGFLLKIGILIDFLISIAEFIYGVFLFLIALEQLEIYTQEKLPQKYEWFLINLFFWSFYYIFIAVVNFIFFIIEYIIKNFFYEIRKKKSYK